MEDVKVNTIDNSEIFDSTVNNKPIKPKKELSVKTKRMIFVWGMLAYPIIQFLIFFVYVNIDSIALSFRYYGENGWEYGTL